MKLKDLSIEQKFQFANDIGKTWKKVDKCGICICLTTLSPEEKSGLMIIAKWKRQRMDEEADVII